MKKTAGVFAMLLGMLCAASPAFSQEAENPVKKIWGNVTATVKSDGKNQLKFRRGTANTFGSLDVFGDRNFDMESFYGEFRARKPIGKGFAVGAEYNGGTNVNDLVRFHASYSRKIGPVYTDVKFSPVATSLEDGMEMGISATADIGNWNFIGWSDIGYDYDKFSYKGELDISRKIGNSAYVVGRVEKYPWQQTPVYSAGLKANF